MKFPLRFVQPKVTEYLLLILTFLLLAVAHIVRADNVIRVKGLGECVSTQPIEYVRGEMRVDCDSLFRSGME